VIDQRLAGGIVEMNAADRYREHFRAAGRVRGLHHRDRRILAGTDKEPRAKRVLADLERGIFNHVRRFLSSGDGHDDLEAVTVV
jgi:hypothetical protein